jgi:THO complex subunit 2
MDLMSFEALLPSFKTIVKDYGIDPSVAFYLWRPILAEKIRQYDVDLTIQEQKKKLLEGLASSDKSTRQDDANGTSATETTEVAAVPAPAPDSMQVEDKKVEKTTTLDPVV